MTLGKEKSGIYIGAGSYVDMTDYKFLVQSLKSITEGVRYDISNLSNASALIWEYMSDLNWAGFYLLKGDNGEWPVRDGDDWSLILGPFQGKVACTVIAAGKGVCGTAAAEDKTQLVYDVHEFPGHIACDAASNSEIVIPIHKDGQVWGVLDIDSPIIGRFSNEDRQGLEDIVKELEKCI